MKSTYIAFPNQAESFFEQATLAYENQQFSKAAELMAQAFNLSQHNMEWFEVLITYLLDAYEEDHALQWFEQCLPQIVTQTDRVEWDYLYLKTLLAVWDFENVERVLTTKMAYYAQHQLDSTSLQWLEQEYMVKKQQLALEQAKERQDVLALVAAIDTLSFYQQQALIPRLRLLEAKQFETSAKTLLTSRVCHPLFKAYVLEQLIETTVEQVPMVWFDQEKIVTIAQLKPVMSTTCYENVMCEIDRVASSEETKAILQQNSLVHISLVYPFQDDVITDVAQWVSDLKNYHEGQHQTNDWLVTLERIMTEMGE